MPSAELSIVRKKKKSGRRQRQCVLENKGPPTFWVETF